MKIRYSVLVLLIFFLGLTLMVPMRAVSSYLNSIEDVAVEERFYTQPPSDDFFFYNELEPFALAIAGEVAPDVSATYAHSFMQILDALYDSAMTEEKVVIR